MTKKSLDQFIGGGIAKTSSSPNIFSDQTASSISINNFLNNRVNEDWWESEFETIEQILKLKYGIDLVGSNREKVHALRRLMNSNLSFVDWYEFNMMCLSLNGSIVDFDTLVQPTPGMIISTVKIMNKLRPDQNKMFGKEVKKYITLSLYDAAIYTPPPSLVDLVSDYMTKYISKDGIRGWKKTVEGAFEIMDGKDGFGADSVELVQSNRIAKAELAANAYNN